MSRLSTLRRQFRGYIQNEEDFADLVRDFDEMAELYGGRGDTPPSVAVALGLRAEQPGGPLEPAIILHVPSDSADGLSLPRRSGQGFPIHVEAVGPILAEPPAPETVTPTPFNSHYDAPPGGVSIAPIDTGYSGTLACYVVCDGHAYALSNRHVLDTSLHPHGRTPGVGAKVLQQSAQDGNTGTDGIAVTSVFAALATSGNNLADAGMALLDRGQAFDVRAVVGEASFANLVRPCTVAPVGHAVYKSGRTTGYTASTVDSFVASLPVTFPNGTVYTFTDCIAIAQHDYGFQAGGDSGALLRDVDNQPVGLMFAASRDKAYALTIANVRTALKAAAGGKDVDILFEQPAAGSPGRKGR